MEIVDEESDEKRVVVRLTDAISNNTYTLELSEEDAKKIETDQLFAEEMLEKIRQEIAENGDSSKEYEVSVFGNNAQIIEEVRNDKDNLKTDIEKEIKVEKDKSEDDMEYEDVEYLDQYDAPDLGNGKKRWTSEQSLELLKAIKYYFEDLKDPRRRKSSWNAICNKVRPKMSPVKIDPQDCRIKWRNLVRTFMNVRKNLKKTGRGPLKFEFYEEIAQILRNDNYRFGYNISPFEDPIFGDFENLNKTKEMDKPRPLIPDSLLNLDITDLQGVDEEESMIPVKKFWAKDQTSSLISAVKTHMCDLRNSKRRKQAWENVAKELKLMGIQLTSLDCKVKWRNLMKSFVSVINNPSDEDPSARFCFYDEVEQAIDVDDPIPFEKPARATSSQSPKSPMVANSVLPSYVVPVVPSDLVGVDRSKYLKLREEKWIKKQEEWRKRHEEHLEKMELRKQEMELEKKKVALLERYLRLQFLEKRKEKD